MGEIDNRTSLAKLGSWHLVIIIVGYRFDSQDDNDDGDDDDGDDGEPHQWPCLISNTYQTVGSAPPDELDKPHSEKSST